MSRSMTRTTTGAITSVVSSLPSALQRRHQARDADGKAGRRHRLAAKARDEPIVAPPAADRAESHDPSLLVGDLGQELGLVDRAGVVFEPANDGGINEHAIDIIAGGIAKL